jgi:putative colanic acid biosynthesis glycosyltransferase
MPTLLQINSVVTFGSSGRVAEDLGQAVMANGWDSYIAYGRYERSSKSKLIKIGTDWDVKMHGLQTRIFDRHGLGSVKATKKLIDCIKQIKPTIIHLHNLHGYYLNIKVLFNYLADKNIPVVWTFHDCWPMTGHCAFFDFIKCEKWRKACYSCPQKNKYPASYFLDRSRKNYHLKKILFTSINRLTIVAVSEWLSNIVKRSFFEKFPVQIINNGINNDVFKPVQDSSIRKKYNLKDNHIILGVANIWDSRKGLEGFLELSRKLDENYRIIIIGLNKLQIITLPSNIIGIPKTENLHELAAWYSAADVFINLSVEESFGLTTAESMSCGTPVIVYNVTASPGLITPETGIIIEKGNIDVLVNAIRQIQSKGKASYTQACVGRARQFYNKDERYKDYLNLYESILNKNADNADIKD